MKIPPNLDGSALTTVIRAHSAERLLSPELFSRIIDGTVSQRDINEATVLSQAAKKHLDEMRKSSEGNQPLGPGMMTRKERALFNEEDLRNLVPAMTLQYEEQPKWRSTIENVKDNLAKWAEKL
jgi:hypothetical protein